MANGFIPNNTFNDVLPPRPRAPLPDRDARDYALRRFREFLAALKFRRTGVPGEPAIAFRIPKLNIHIYQPDDIENMAMPSFSVVPGRGVHEPYGIGPPVVIEETFNRFAPGTALVRQYDYVETFTLECWGSKHAERRAMVAGIKHVMSLNDGSSAIRLSLPSYYDMVASFSLDESGYLDQDEVARNRRRAHLFIKLQVVEVALINLTTMRVQIVDENLQQGLGVLDGNVYSRLD